VTEEEREVQPDAGETPPDDALAVWAKAAMTLAPFLLLALLVAALMRLD